MRPVRFFLLACAAFGILSACAAPAYHEVSDPSDGDNAKTKHHLATVDR
jgi:hypothetical protein